MDKLIVISAPSGAGKTSIVNFLLGEIKQLSFSISACSRSKRENEVDGVDYYFLSVDNFQRRIKKGDFLEWEEVYKNQFYGTLNTEVNRIWGEGKTAIFDLDVIGGIKIKKKYKSKCLSIFIKPPSLSVLKERLLARGSENTLTLNRRIEKAKKEIAKSNKFDNIILNDDFGIACNQAKEIIKKFIL